MSINYRHRNNVHTLEGPRAALPVLVADIEPTSLLDVGCGTGTWLKAAHDIGVETIYGIDGVEISQEDFHVSKSFFQMVDLERDWQLARRFDVALCLEVAEHLPADASRILVRALADHSDTIFFSAACPRQEGEHHVNCQWPSYWQQLFNQVGYRCDDSPRWRIWDDERIEPWYRQNLFVATRGGEGVGKEPRIASVVHPAMVGGRAPSRNEIVKQVAEGSERLGWYVGLPVRALLNKLSRRRSRG